MEDRSSSSAQKRRHRSLDESDRGSSESPDAFGCLLLELLAFVLHPDSTESTSTICLSFQSSTLYLTSQTNLDFGYPKADDIKEKLAVIRLALLGELGPPQGKEGRSWLHDSWAKKKERDDEGQLQRPYKKKKSAGALLDYYCACMQKVPEHSAKARDHLRQKVGPVLESTFFPLFSAAQKNFNQAVFQRFRDAITNVQVVKSEHLFPLSSGHETSHLHGESRIIRYFFITNFTNLSQKATSLRSETAGFSEVRGVLDEFAEYLKDQDLWMGSSQGTCAFCKGCTRTYNIKTGKEGNIPKGWLHPIHYMKYSPPTFSLQPTALRHHAFRCFFADDHAGWVPIEKLLLNYLDATPEQREGKKRHKTDDKAKGKEKKGGKGGEEKGD